MQDILMYQWGADYHKQSPFFLVLAPLSKKPAEYFNAFVLKGKATNVTSFTSSLGDLLGFSRPKSITQCRKFRIGVRVCGGIAYAVYYLSFVVAGIIIYRLNEPKEGLSKQSMIS